MISILDELKISMSEFQTSNARCSLRNIKCDFNHDKKVITRWE